MAGLAELYSDLLQDEFGDDEFHLFGCCGGGAISVELGRIATERGLNLRKTIIVDGYLDLHSTGPMSETELLIDFHNSPWSDLTAAEPAAAMTEQNVDIDAVMRHAAVALFGTSMGLDQRAEAFCRRMWVAFQHAANALTIYRPEPVDVDVLLLLAKDNFTLDDWRTVITGELTAEVLDSDFHGQRLCTNEAAYLVGRTLDYLGKE